MKKTLAILAAVLVSFSLTASSCDAPVTVKERTYNACIEQGGDYSENFWGQPNCDLPDN